MFTAITDNVPEIKVGSIFTVIVLDPEVTAGIVTGEAPNEQVTPAGNVHLYDVAPEVVATV